jgi:hypothetical protein
MMDIYSYLDSPDIAEHCRKIGHKFDTLEAAWVVASCESKTRAQKHEGWRGIIETMPDMPNEATGARVFNAHPSVHQYLLDRIAREEAEERDFYTPPVGAVYVPIAKDESGCNANGSDGFSSKSLGVFTTAQKALEAVRGCFESEYVFRICVKLEIPDGGTAIEALFDYGGELLDIYREKSDPDDEGYVDELVERMYIHLPVPFEKGDIVRLERHDDPCVLDSILYWRKDYDVWRQRNGDSSDMQVDVYLFDEDDRFRWDWIPCGLTRLRYYDGEFTGKYKFMPYLSKYIKESDRCGADWIINAFCKFKDGTDAEKLGEWFDGEYIPLDKQ